MSGLPQELIISADSHVIEDSSLWSERLPAQMKKDAPVFPPREVRISFQATQEGGWNPSKRIEEMAVDGVSQEILYPSWAMNLFGLADPRLQEACLRVYNDWLIEYCSVAPDRVFGIATLCTYDIRHAVSELERCKQAGLVGGMVWEVPPDDLSFTSSHYDELWAAAESLEMPISLHTQTGGRWVWPRPARPEVLQPFARHANNLVMEGANAVADLITSGTFERFPRLKFVLVESEASWIPGLLGRYDHYHGMSNISSPLSMTPSECFERNFYATFFEDKAIGGVLTTWGTNNCMWSNDFPHPNSTWPHSREVIERELGHLPASDRQRLIAGNVMDLYQLPKLDLVKS